MSMHKVLCIVTFKQAVKLKNQPAQDQVVCLREAWGASAAARVLGMRRKIETRGMEGLRTLRKPYQIFSFTSKDYQR